MTPTADQRALLRLAGFFPWGMNAWIHEDDLGTVLDTEAALEQARALAREARG